MRNISKYVRGNSLHHIKTTKIKPGNMLSFNPKNYFELIKNSSNKKGMGVGRGVPISCRVNSRFDPNKPTKIIAIFQSTFLTYDI